jgi:hypothetical protein
MTRTSPSWVQALLIVAGAVLMVGGIATRAHGASIVGLVVAAVNVSLWQRARRSRPAGGQGDAQP